MVELKVGLEDMDWTALTELYGEVPLLGGHGKKREQKLVHAAFSASGKVVTAWEGRKLVAAGRMLTDGICYGAIFDIAVLPAFRKRGIGKAVVDELMKGYEHISVLLTYTPGNGPFYEESGFTPCAEAMTRRASKSAKESFRIESKS
jgi:aralkylamine N-acetyltransferase